MLTDIAVGIHGYNGPGASVFVIGTIAVIVLIVVWALVRGNGNQRRR